MCSPVKSGSGTIFPVHTFSEKPDLNELVVAWYSKHLSAMNEPSLWKVSGEKGTESYRFTWLRTFHAPYVFRLDVRPDGTGSQVVKCTNGKGGYNPGRLVLNKRIALEVGQVRRVTSALSEIGFWNLPTKDLSHAGLDGAQWVFEGVKDGRYHVVNRWTPENGTFRKVMLDLVALGSVNVEPIY